MEEIDAREPSCHESGNVTKRRMQFVVAADRFLKAIGVRTVLDVGCAGITRQWWLDNGYEWHGLTFPRDAEKLRGQGIAVDVGDVASMPYDDGAFDLVYASHVVEHSPMPLVALMECARVARALALAVPRWPRMVDEPYHYSCMPAEVWRQWFAVSGWTPVVDLTGSRDFEWLCVQKEEDAAAIKPVVAAFVKERQAQRQKKARRRAARRTKRKARR